MRPIRSPSGRSLRVELSLGLAVLVSVGILIVGALLYQHQRYALEMYLGMSLQNVAQTAASFLTGEDHRQATGTPRPSPASAKLQAIVDGVRSANPLTVDVYTLEPRVGGGMQFAIVAAGGSRPPGAAYWPGEATAPVLQRVLQEGRSGYSRMYLDERGHCLSAFAPIRDRNGVPVAVLGVDYAANVLWGELRMFRWRIMGFSLLGALVALSAGVWYARRITRPLEEMAVQAREVAEGDFSRRLAPAGSAEVAGLAETLNRMASRIEEQLDAFQRAQLDRAHEDRLASLGAIAAELVHEMTQPLTAIQGLSQGVLEQSSELTPETRRYLEVVVNEARRLRELSRRLREFSRRSRGERRLADLNGIVQDALLLVRATARERHVRLEEDLAPQLPEVAVDRQGFVQVLLNLLTNALDAVADGREDGRVRVTTADLGPPGGAHTIEIAVIDNGPGITPDIRPQIFEPFFSTKDPSRGTGLGLAVSKEIVERHGGTIGVETAPGGGTRIVVSVPVLPTRQPESSAAVLPAGA